MLTVDEALVSILQHVSPLESTVVTLADSLGRVLAQDVLADIANPPFDNSAVDGYAMLAEDTFGASAERPALLREVGEAHAGSPSLGVVTAGTCMRVMTGAPIPVGADVMVMREDAEQNDGVVTIRNAAVIGDHIRSAGGDFRRGDCVLHTGTVIGSAEVAMLAAVGRNEVSVIRRPRVAVFSTGDELVDIGTVPGPGQIRDSNRHTLEALVREAGAEIAGSKRLPDELIETENAFSQAAGSSDGEGADVIVTSGGVSVGDRDFVRPALLKLGSLDIWRVRMKPGKPLAFGRIGETLFFGLPGNPVSTMVTFELFVRPVLWKMAGRTMADRPRVRVVLEEAVPHAEGRREFVRAVVWQDGASLVARPTGAQGSGALSSMLGANALIVLDEGSSGLAAGSTGEALLISNLLTGRPE